MQKIARLTGFIALAASAVIALSRLVRMINDNDPVTSLARLLPAPLSHGSLVNYATEWGELCNGRAECLMYLNAGIWSSTPFNNIIHHATAKYALGFPWEAGTLYVQISQFVFLSSILTLGLGIIVFAGLARFFGTRVTIIVSICVLWYWLVQYTEPSAPSSTLPKILSQVGFMEVARFSFVFVAGILGASLDKTRRKWALYCTLAAAVFFLFIGPSYDVGSAVKLVLLALAAAMIGNTVYTHSRSGVLTAALLIILLAAIDDRYFIWNFFSLAPSGMQLLAAVPILVVATRAPNSRIGFLLPLILLFHVFTGTIIALTVLFIETTTSIIEKRRPGRLNIAAALTSFIGIAILASYNANESVTYVSDWPTAIVKILTSWEMYFGLILSAIIAWFGFRLLHNPLRVSVGKALLYTAIAIATSQLSYTVLREFGTFFFAPNAALTVAGVYLAPFATHTALLIILIEIFGEKEAENRPVTGKSLTAPKMLIPAIAGICLLVSTMPSLSWVRPIGFNTLAASIKEVVDPGSQINPQLAAIELREANYGLDASEPLGTYNFALWLRARLMALRDAAN